MLVLRSVVLAGRRSLLLPHLNRRLRGFIATTRRSSDGADPPQT